MTKESNKKKKHEKRQHMEVPFRAIIIALRELLHLDLPESILGFQDKKEQNLSLLHTSQSSIKDYMLGHRKDDPCKISVPKKSTFETIFDCICSPNLYNVNSQNYQEKALLLINYLLNNKLINTDYINVQSYIDKIGNEKPPIDDDLFYVFLFRSAFYDFLCAFIELQRDPKYRDSIPPQARMVDSAKPEIVMANHFGDNYEKYMLQQLVSEETNEVLLSIEKLTNNDFDFSFFIENKLTLICGPGGQGKTSFLCALQILSLHSQKQFNGVFVIPLINLTELSVDSGTVNKDFIENYIKQNYLGSNINDKSFNYLILLDGFNEFRSSKNKHIVGIIIDSINRLISDINNKNKPNISLVITTRESKTTLNLLPNAGKEFTKTLLKGTPDDLFESIRKKYERFDYKFKGSEIERLAKIPLYALMFDEFDDSETIFKIQNKYSLFNEVYRIRANQRLGNELHKGAYNKAYYLYVYYVILPAFAYALNTSKEYNNDYFFYSDNIEELLKTIVENGLDKLLFRYHLKNYKNIDSEFDEISILSLKRFFENEESIIIDKILIDDDYNDFAFRFKHQEWRDYLIAKHLNDNINLLKSIYNHKNDNYIRTLHLNCNVDSNIGKMVLQSFNMDSTEEQNKKIANKFFSLGENPKFSNHLYGIVKLLHVAFDFNEYLQLRLPIGKNKEIVSLHRVFYQLTDFLKKNSNNPILINIVKNDNDMLMCICEILSKEAEFFRRDNSILGDKHYQESFNIIELAKRFSKNNDIMQNQEGKLYVYLFEESLKGSKKRFQRIIPKEIGKMKPYEMFLKGTEILTQVAKKGFHLSANAIGIILTNPAPELIFNIADLKPDFCAAFKYYMEVVYGAKYINRDISYTIRQSLNLLMNRYIKISDTNCFTPDDLFSNLSNLQVENCAELFKEKINVSTLKFAKSLVRKADGQDLANMNFLRGYVAYLEGNSFEAKVFWNSKLKHENPLMYLIARKYCLNEKNLDDNINLCFEDIIERIKVAGNGSVDLTHPIYRYIEAKEFELIVTNSHLKNIREEYFKRIEEENNVIDLVNSILTFFKKL